MASLFVKIPTVEGCPRPEIFDASGKQIRFALDYFCGQGDTDRSEYDTYFAKVDAGGYWTIVHCDSRELLCKAVAHDDVAQCATHPVADVTGLVDDDGWEALQQAFREHQVPRSVIDALVGRTASVYAH